MISKLEHLVVIFADGNNIEENQSKVDRVIDHARDTSMTSPKLICLGKNNSNIAACASILGTHFDVGFSCNPLTMSTAHWLSNELRASKEVIIVCGKEAWTHIEVTIGKKHIDICEGDVFAFFNLSRVPALVA